MKNKKHFIILFIFLITNSLTYSQNKKLNVLILPSVECLNFFKCTKDNGEADYKKAIIRRELNLYSEKLRLSLNSNPYFNLNQLKSIQLDNKKTEEINLYIFKSFDLILEYDFHCQNNGGINYFTKSINFKVKDKKISSYILSYGSAGGIGSYEDPNFLVNEMIDSEFLDKLNIKMDAVYNYFEILPMITFNIERVKFVGKKSELNNYKSYFLFPNSQESYGDKIHKQLNGEIELTIAFDGKVYSGQYIGQYMKTKMQIFENRDKNGVIEKVETDKSSFDWPHGNGKFISNGLIIEGDWLEGKLNGHGILESKDSDEKLLFKYDGNFNNNIRQGKGIFSFENYYSYNGEWLNNAIDGIGKITYSQGNTYEGFWKNNLREGKGVYINNRDKNVFTKIEGNWTLNFKEGDGIIYFLNGDSLRGSVNNNIFPKYTGNGILHTNDAIYTGDFVNSEYTGKGSLEYLNGNYKKGLFLDGALQEGTVNLHYKDSSSYLGEMKNEKFNGQGIYSWSDGNYKKGLFLDGALQEGIVNLHYKDSTSYLGEMKNEKFDGQGTFTWANGNYYSGIWKDGKQNGQGKLVNSDGMISEGLFADNHLKMGEITKTNGEYFKGIWDINSVFRGKSKKISNDKSIWEGEWEDGIPISNGRVTFTDGSIYVGEWSGRSTADFNYYEINGIGKMTYPNNEVYEGNFKLGIREGNGTFTYKNGDIYEGNWVNDLRSGNGTINYSNGDSYSGEWSNNIRNGSGKYTYSNGRFEKCFFENDKFIKEYVCTSTNLLGTVFMSKNLDIQTFRNGDKINLITNEKDWMKAADENTPACCCYQFNSENCKKYGLLYNHFAVTDSRVLAPRGWRIINTSDVLTLEKFTQESLCTTNSWKNKQGTNTALLNIVPSGYLNFSSGYWMESVNHYMESNSSFIGAKETSHFWFISGTDNNTTSTYFSIEPDYLHYSLYSSNGSGLSVRCVKE